ncbi:MAG: DNA-directed RNA polymerase subunit H [Candidatus Bathyarchaeota archaeon B26-2]|nr:MAG: DNA-directed RNA polymerase subunit H [Candidatus Bathyarchaeota archaeon B26-2]
MIRKKISFFLRFRGYVIEEEKKEKEGLKEIVVTEKNGGKILVHVVYRTASTSGVVGVHYVRKMSKQIKEGDYKGGILIGEHFSHSARKEAKNRGVETITEGSLPIFNIFDHDLVPKHEIIPREEAEKLLKKYRINPYNLPHIKASDPIAILIGAKPGDIVKITRRSPTAGFFVSYRYVV